MENIQTWSDEVELGKGQGVRMSFMQGAPKAQLTATKKVPRLGIMVVDLLLGVKEMEQLVEKLQAMIPLVQEHGGPEPTEKADEYDQLLATVMAQPEPTEEESEIEE